MNSGQSVDSGKSSRSVRRIFWHLLICVVLPSTLMVGSELVAQQTSQPQQGGDNQIAATINSQLQASSQLRPLDLGVWVHDGIATLTGTVPTPELRNQAESVVRGVQGVKSIDDQIKVGTPSATAPGFPAGDNSATQQSAEVAPPPPTQQDDIQQGNPEDGNLAPVSPEDNTAPPEDEQNPPPPAQNLDQNGPPPAQQNSQSGPPPPPPPPQEAQAPREAPILTVAAGTPVTIMMLDGVDSKHTEAGTHFRGVLVRDVILQNGIIAIPRGAYVHGTVIDARGPGHLKGHPKLALQLDNLELLNNHYPLTSYIWDRRGPGKGGQTAGNVVGGALLGTFAGAIFGGGSGALIGAGVGGLGGAGISALSSGAHLRVPAEAVITFYLNAPLTLRELNMNEIRSLAGNVPATGYRNGPPPNYRGYPPPPPPPPGGPPGGYPY